LSNELSEIDFLFRPSLYLDEPIQQSKADGIDIDPGFPLFVVLLRDSICVGVSQKRCHLRRHMGTPRISRISYCG
jgi:hypothetical protein